MDSHQAHEEGDVELELAALQRKYRIMEGNRKSYSEDSQKTIANQRLTIEKLKKDNNSLKTEINLHKKRELAPMTPNMPRRPAIEPPMLPSPRKVSSRGCPPPVPPTFDPWN